MTLRATFVPLARHTARALPGLLAAGLLGCAAMPPRDTLPINHIQVVGTHNSYHAGIAPEEAILWKKKNPKLYALLDYRHPSLTRQLESGVRQLELDVYADPQGGRYAHPYGPDLVKAAHLPPDPPFDPDGLMARPGFKVMHVNDVDYRSVCQPFVACLREIRDWSHAHPDHVPVYILVETKQTAVKLPFPSVAPLRFTPELFDSLDAEIRSVFPSDEMLTPDALRGSAATLPQAIGTAGWPSLATMRGRVVFLMDQRVQESVYIDGHPALRGRAMFTNATPGAPDAAFTEVNVPGPAIGDLVEHGYLVRTRSDDGLVEARANDTHRRDAALASGAQIVSTDYPAAEPASSGYSVSLAPGARSSLAARCDPAFAGPCPAGDLETHGTAAPAGR